MRRTVVIDLNIERKISVRNENGHKFNTLIIHKARYESVDDPLKFFMRLHSDCVCWPTPKNNDCKLILCLPVPLLCNQTVIELRPNMHVPVVIDEDTKSFSMVVDEVDSPYCSKPLTGVLEIEFSLVNIKNSNIDTRSKLVVPDYIQQEEFESVLIQNNISHANHQ